MSYSKGHASLPLGLWEDARTIAADYRYGWHSGANYGRRGEDIPYATERAGQTYRLAYELTRVTT